MELLNVRWIFQNYFIGGVFRRWYVVLFALAGLWGVLEIWTRKDQKVVIKMVILALAAFVFLIILLFLFNVLSALVKTVKTKTVKPLCPHCFVPMPIDFTCKCSTKVKVPFVVYLTKGLFLNHCPGCSGKFFLQSSDDGALRGKCRKCGNVIDDWRFYSLHRGEIFVTIEKSLDNKMDENYLNGWETGSYHQTVKGCEHYVRKRGKIVQHWFRWESSLKAAAISQHITENIHYIWIDHVCGSSDYQETHIIINTIRRNFKQIKFAYEGNAAELQDRNLGIKGNDIAHEISMEDFLDQFSNNKSISNKNRP